MRWLLASLPVVLGGAGLTVLSIAPGPGAVGPAPGQFPGTPAPGSGEDSAAVVCAADAGWSMPLSLARPPLEDADATETGPLEGVIETVQGELESVDTPAGGIVLSVGRPGASPERVALMHPACMPGGGPLRWLAGAAWDAWHRSCCGCGGDDPGPDAFTVTFIRRPGDALPLAIGLAGLPCGAGARPTATPTPTPADPPADDPDPSPGHGEPCHTVAPGASPSPGATVPGGASPTAPSTPTRAAAPTATAVSPTPTATRGSSLSVVAYTARVARGDTASLTVRTAPGSACEIRYTTPSGTVSKASGLEQQAAGADGTASWSWTVSSRTSPGTGSVTVTCGSESLTLPLEVV